MNKLIPSCYNLVDNLVITLWQPCYHIVVHCGRRVYETVAWMKQIVARLSEVVQCCHKVVNKIIKYCMIQNSDGKNFDEWRSGKFWQKNFDKFHNVNTCIYWWLVLLERLMGKILMNLTNLYQFVNIFLIKFSTDNLLQFACQTTFCAGRYW